MFCSVQSLGCVWLFATPWTAVSQASLSITNSWSPPKPMSIVLVSAIQQCKSAISMCVYVCVYMYPLTLVPPSNPSPLSHHRALGWTPCCCSVTKLCPTLCNPVSCSTPGLPVLHYLLAFAQTHVHWVGDAIQPSHPLSSPSPALSLSQHQGLFQWVGFSHQVAKVLELQLPHQSILKETLNIHWKAPCVIQQLPTSCLFNTW